MFSEAMPSDVRNPTQNWCVFQTFRTRGIPTRICDRSLTGGPAEGFFPNQVGSVGIGILGLLHLALDLAHLVRVLDQPLRTRVVDDESLPAGSERNLAPFPPLAFRQLDV